MSVFLLLFIISLANNIDQIKSTNASSSPSTTSHYCRSRGKLLPDMAFQLETCAQCYMYMPPNMFNNGSKFGVTYSKNYIVEGKPVPWMTNNLGIEVLADPYLNDSALLDSFVDSQAEDLWRDCCDAAKKCCDAIKINATQRQQAAPATEAGGGDRCAPTWDGWQCWPDGAEAGQTVYESCPSYIFFHTGGGGLMQNTETCGQYVSKVCDASGHWFKRKNREWTNFGTCSRVNTLLSKEYVHIGLYCVSIVALFPALIIFFSYKILRVPRIAIHKNLFASLLIHCVSMIAFKGIVLLPYIQKEANIPTLLEMNTIGCQTLLMISKYYRLTNYTWMFCEGYYLHRLLVNTFEEERSLKVIVAIGWGLPVLPCLVYAVLRYSLDNAQCWALPAESEPWIEWIYMIPGLLCILANFCFFLNIFRILVTKLQAPHANEPAHFRKAVHATVVLLPLFGLHWLLTLYRPQEGAHCVWETFYKYLNVILDGLQGLMVAIAFCYRNGEIRVLLHQTRKRLGDRFPIMTSSSSAAHNGHHNGDHNASSSHTAIPMKELKKKMKKNQRKDSETCFTQIGESKYSLSESPSSDHKQHAHNNKDDEESAFIEVQQGQGQSYSGADVRFKKAKTTLEQTKMKKKNKSNLSSDDESQSD